VAEPVGRTPMKSLQKSKSVLERVSIVSVDSEVQKTSCAGLSLSACPNLYKRHTFPTVYSTNFSLYVGEWQIAKCETIVVVRTSRFGGNGTGTRRRTTRLGRIKLLVK
jgi:hypothetical protein